MSPAWHRPIGAPGPLTAVVVVLVVATAVACTRSSGRADESVAAAGPVAVPVPTSTSSGTSQLRPVIAGAAATLSDVDWRNVTYLSACGLSDVLVVHGSGGQVVDGTAYGIDVVDVALGDLTRDGDEDAAVLVDCIGGPEPFPHVIVVDSNGVTRLAPTGTSTVGALAVAPSSGGSIGYGQRPMWIGVGPGPDISVRTDTTTAVLEYAPGVLVGGELESPGPATYQGTLVGAVDGIMTIALTPDDGYRIPFDRGLPVVDAGTGATVAISDLVGEDLSVFVDVDGRASSVQHLPRGAA